MTAKIAPPNPAPTATSIDTLHRWPEVKTASRRRDRANLLVQYSEQRRLICDDLAHPEPRAGGPGHAVSNATHACAQVFAEFVLVHDAIIRLVRVPDHVLWLLEGASSLTISYPPFQMSG
jgi:hypothetical protein